MIALSALLAVLTGPVAFAETAPLRATEPAAPAMKPNAPAAPAARLGGKVLETMNSGNYTYVRLETPGGEKWVAAPQTAVKVGDAVEFQGGMEMKGFASKTLGRTFDSILFADSISVGGASGAAAPASPHGAVSGKAAEGSPVTGIKKAEGGLTVAEIYTRRAEFDGKEVTVRGKVMKFNAGVMSRNWLHLRDGTSSAAGENDLTITSAGQADVGDIVLVTGKLTLNKDFGFNYKYDVLIEDAKVAIEEDNVAAQ